MPTPSDARSGSVLLAAPLKLIRQRRASNMFTNKRYGNTTFKYSNVTSLQQLKLDMVIHDKLKTVCIDSDLNHIHNTLLYIR